MNKTPRHSTKLGVPRPAEPEPSDDEPTRVFRTLPTPPPRMDGPVDKMRRSRDLMRPNWPPQPLGLLPSPWFWGSAPGALAGALGPALACGALAGLVVGTEPFRGSLLGLGAALLAAGWTERWLRELLWRKAFSSAGPRR